MGNIEIIDKADIPSGPIRWGKLLNNLTYGKAIKLVCPSQAEATKKQNNVGGSFRKTRIGKQDFYIETRITRLEDNQWALFVWKEEKNNGM